MILQTKLNVPPAGNAFVARPRLYVRMDEILERKVALISAPAGYGKTTLLTAWLQRLSTRRNRVVWLSLDAADDDLHRFLTYLVAALRQHDANVGSRLQKMLEAAQPPPLETLMTTLVNDLNAVGAHTLLVLDDYHEIHSPEVHTALAFLVDHLPPQVHLIISSRCDPPFSLVRLRAKEKLVEIRADDLRFTVEEAGQFLNDVMALGFSPDTISLLDDRTEGWIAGLQLAALIARFPLVADHRGDLSKLATGFDKGHAYIFDYLAEEVLDRQSEMVQRFLLSTAILDRFSSPLCDAVIEAQPVSVNESRVVLEDVMAANLFLIPLDEERRWYRYHHLFASFLRQQLERRYPAEVPALHRRASAWFEENDLREEAVRHAVAAGDMDRAAELVSRYLKGLFLRGQLNTIRHYVEMLPDEIIQSRLQFCTAYAWVLALGGQSEWVEKYVQQAERCLQQWERRPSAPFSVEALRSNLALVRATVAQQHGNFVDVAETSRRALNTLDDSAPGVRSIAALMLGSACLNLGKVQETRRALIQSVIDSQAIGHSYVTISALQLLADVHRRQAQLHAAGATYRRILQLVETLPPEDQPPLLASVYIGLGRLAREWNDLPQAAEMAARAVELCESSGELGSVIQSYTLLALVHQAQGNLEEMSGALRQAEAVAHRRLSPLDIIGVTVWQARYWLYAGNVVTAAVLAKQAAAELEAIASEPSAFSMPQELVDMTLARVHIAQGHAKASAAVPILKRWQRFALSAGLSAVVIETLLLQTHAYQLLGNTYRARGALERALKLAEPGGYVRLFLDEGPVIAGILRELAVQSPASSYANRLLGAFAVSPLGASVTIGVIEPLTPRQQEILKLLATGMSNHEIAGQLVISVETVRWHTKEIFRRLDVRNRTEAALRARDYNLLSS
ncbi:MAG TPA: LuxR C-terminal-related transcriptional regulator [Anaerolineae bacterium]